MLSRNQSTAICFRLFAMIQTCTYRFYLNKDWGCIILREIDFLLKICWSIPCFHRGKYILEYVNTYNSYNCSEIITKPTRITTTSTSSTLINHIYTNLPASKPTPGILLNDLSDHLPLFVSIKSKISKKWNLKSCNRHDYSNFNAENFVTKAKEALDNLPINQNNPCETLDSCILLLEQCLNEQAPAIKLSKAKQKLSHKPWITPCLLKSLKKTRTGYIELWCVLVLVAKRPMQSIKSTGTKLLIY